MRMKTGDGKGLQTKSSKKKKKKKKRGALF
jgi:hypothetical protein